MAIRDKLQAAVAPNLRAGEQVQSVFIAQRGNPGWFLVSYWVIIAKGYYAIAVTDQRVLVYRTSALAMTKLKNLVKELPRTTTFGNPEGKINYKLNLAGEDVWVHRRFWDDVRRADAALGH